MKAMRIVAVSLAVAAGPAFADRPEPSFNDAPDLHSHQTAKDARTSASQGPSGPSGEDRRDYGPWITIPSSGA